MAATRQEPLPRQYQHYVPQFLQRNFSLTTIPGAGRPSGSRRTRLGSNQKVVNHVDLSAENATVEARGIRRVFGEYNMYDDAARLSEQHGRIEKKLSGLESAASHLFRKMLDAHGDSHKGLWLTRCQRNLIRKFLFVMKYRGPTFYARYRHDTLDTYTAEDRDELSAYMQSKGFSKPIDVWLDNIEKLIDLEMDVKLEWMAGLSERMYHPDAMWAARHCQLMYMAICTPADPAGEFILTDNCYHVAEGPHNTSTNLQTGESILGAWLSLHEFAPVSPKLMIVLRSFLFASELDDVSNPAAKSLRETFRSIIEASHGSIDDTLLAKLPVSKSRNNYTTLTSGALVLDSGETGALKPQHSFFFQFFPINLAHVNRINGVFLENTDSCKSIVFKSKGAFRQTLHWYLTDREVFRKRVSANPGDSRRVCLEKLEVVLHTLGSSAKLYMEERSLPVLTRDEMLSARFELLRHSSLPLATYS